MEKLLSLLSFIFLFASTSLAQDKGSSDTARTPKADSSKSDTISFFSGESTEILLIDHGEDDTDHVDPPYWGGFDIFLGSYLNAKNSLALSEDNAFLKRKYQRSIGFGFNFIEMQLFPFLYSEETMKHFSIVSGIGVDFFSYSFAKGMRLHSSDSAVWGRAMPEQKVERNTLNLWYVNAPLLLEFATHDDPDQAFHLGMGGFLSYKIGNRYKRKYKEDGKQYKTVVKEPFNVSPWKYGLMARIGYDHYVIFGRYSLSPMFQAGKGPKMNQVSLGIRLLNW